MASRAYLICEDSPQPAGCNTEGQASYPSSAMLSEGGSYIVPVFWFSLFDPSCLTHFEDGDYRVPTLVCGRGAALENLRRHRERMLGQFPDCEPHWDRWEALVRGATGQYFKLDATEIRELDPVSFEAKFTAASRWLNTGDAADLREFLRMSDIYQDTATGAYKIGGQPLQSDSLLFGLPCAAKSIQSPSPAPNPNPNPNPASSPTLASPGPKPPRLPPATTISGLGPYAPPRPPTPQTLGVYTPQLPGVPNIQKLPPRPPRPGIKRLIGGIIILIFGFLSLPFILLVPLIMENGRKEPFKAPGVLETAVESPGRYGLYHEFSIFFDGRTYQREPDLPDGLEIHVRDGAGGELPFKPNNPLPKPGTNTNRIMIGSIVMDEPGAVVIEATGGDRICILSFSHSRIDKTDEKMSTTIALTAVLPLIGLIFIVWGIVRLVTHRPHTPAPPLL